MKKDLIVLSLGAGVQSTAMALMCESGDLPYKVDFAVFADTKAEPQSVYDNLDLIKKHVSYPVYIVSNGDLEKDLFESISEGKRAASVPFFVKTGDKVGMLKRQCTQEYKIKPIRRFIRPKLAKGQKAKMLIGISLDEAHRMKPSNVKYIENCYPLAFSHYSRQDCLLWLEKTGINRPPKSACYFCPYKSDHEFNKMKDNQEWAGLLSFEEKINSIQSSPNNKIRGKIYLHRSCKPINEIDFNKNKNQFDLFGEECEGICGL